MQLQDQQPPRRFHHCLFAYASSDDDLNSVASSKRLIWTYERRFIPGQFLKGFQGDFYWRNGTLKFSLHGDAIPEFGLLASLELRYIPIVYFMDHPSSSQVRKKYYYAGKQVKLSCLPRDTVAKYKAMIQQKSGTIEPRATLMRFFANA